MMFQMTFAIITPALITGAFAERMKFSRAAAVHAACGRSSSTRRSPTGSGAAASWAAWACSTSPAARWCTSTPASPAWSAPWCSASASASARQHGAAQPGLRVIGASLLWVGWFGFNAGSAVGANGRAGMAMVATQIADGGGGAGLDVRRVGRPQGKPTRARHHLRRGRRPGRHHPGLRLRLPGAARWSSASSPASVCFWRRHRAEALARLRRHPGRLRRARRRRHRSARC